MLRRKFTKLFLEIHIFALFSMMGRGEWRLNTCQGPIFTIFNNHIFYLYQDILSLKLHYSQKWKRVNCTSMEKQLVWLHWARLLFHGKDSDAVFYWALHLILNHCRVYWVLQSSFLVAGSLKSFSVGLGAKFLEKDHCIHQPSLILGNSFYGRLGSWFIWQKGISEKVAQIPVED